MGGNEEEALRKRSQLLSYSRTCRDLALFIGLRKLILAAELECTCGQSSKILSFGGWADRVHGEGELACESSW